VYAVGHRVLSREATFMAAVLVTGDAVLSHRSAAVLWDLTAGERRDVEISVPRALRPRPRLEIHRACLPADEVTVCARIPVTTPARTLYDLASVLPSHRLERAATEAEIRRLTSPTSLDALVARYPRRAGNAAIRALLAAQAIGRNVTRRELELRFLGFLDEAGLPRPQVNAMVDLPSRPREVDCLWVHRRLVAELDGFSTHGTRAAFEEDRARDRALQAAGYRVVRITWRQLHEERTTVARQLQALLAGPWSYSTRGGRNPSGRMSRPVGRRSRSSSICQYQREKVMPSWKSPTCGSIVSPAAIRTMSSG
jgi:Protein of unknown function (DUF559)